MVPYYGDFAEDDTVYLPFNTFDSNDPSASVTITNLADTDIHVHKDGGTTQTTTGATVAINYDSITGNHLITVVTTDAFYTTGADYSVRIEGTTVDAGTINAWVGAFSIERAGGVLALLKGTDSLATIHSETTVIASDVIVLTTDVASLSTKQDSDMVVLNTSHTKTQSDVTLVDTNVAALSTKQDSDMVVVDASHTKTQSDIVLLSDKADSDMVLVIADHDKTQSDVALVQVDTTVIKSDTVVLEAGLQPMIDGRVTATVNDASATTTAFAADGFTPTARDTVYNGRLITFLSGNVKDEQTEITGYDHTGGTQGEQEFTVAALTQAPDNNATFFIH